MTTVSLNDLLLALDWVSSGNLVDSAAFISLEQGMHEAWYQYESRAVEKALREWGEQHDLLLVQGLIDCDNRTKR